MPQVAGKPRSYFESCPRDKLGHCLPSGRAGDQAAQKPAAVLPESDQDISAAHEDWVKNGTRAKAFKDWFGDWEHEPDKASKVVDHEGKPKETHNIPGSGSQVIEDDKPIAVYHGTSTGGFDEFDPNKVDNNALYGPGFYFTENKKIAEGYTDKGAFIDVPLPKPGGRNKKPEVGDKVADGIVSRVEQVGDSLRVFFKDPQKSELKTSYLNIRNPFRVDGLISREDVVKLWGEKIAKRLDNQYGYTMENGKHMGQIVYDKGQEENFYLMPEHERKPLIEKYGMAMTVAKVLAAEKLKGAGYDGITHIGGAGPNSPKHRVWIAFAPTQIKSATGNRGTFDPASANINKSVQIPSTNANLAVPILHLAPMGPEYMNEPYMTRKGWTADCAGTDTACFPRDQHSSATRPRPKPVLPGMDIAALDEIEHGAPAWAFQKPAKQLVRGITKDMNPCDLPSQLIALPNIRQPDDYSCGACCAFSTGRYFGVGPDTLEEWKKILHTTVQESTSPQRIADYLADLGLHVETKSGMTIEDLADCFKRGVVVVCPIKEYGIASKQASRNYGHFVCSIGIGFDSVFVFDPSVDNVVEGEDSDEAPGRMMIDQTKFLEVWHDKDADGNELVRYGIAVSRSGTEQKDWDPDKHPRGQPTNAGQFAAKPAGVLPKPEEVQGKPQPDKPQGQASANLARRIAAEGGGANDLAERAKPAKKPTGFATQARRQGAVQRLGLSIAYPSGRGRLNDKEAELVGQAADAVEFLRGQGVNPAERMGNADESIIGEVQFSNKFAGSPVRYESPATLIFNPEAPLPPAWKRRQDKIDAGERPDSVVTSVRDEVANIVASQLIRDFTSEEVSNWVESMQAADDVGDKLPALDANDNYISAWDECFVAYAKGMELPKPVEAFMKEQLATIGNRMKADEKSKPGHGHVGSDGLWTESPHDDEDEPDDDTPPPSLTPEKYSKERERLGTMKVTSHKKISNHNTNETLKITLADGSHACFKPQDGEKPGIRGETIPDGGLYKREAAVSLIANLAGFEDLVPPTTIGEVDGRKGSIQAWQEGANVADSVPDREMYDGYKDGQRVKAFDYLIAHSDRHPNNWMLKGGKISLIDNGCSLPVKEGDWQGNNSWDKSRFNDMDVPDMSKTKKAWPQIERELLKIGLEPEAVNLTKKRLDNLVEGHEQGLTFGDLTRIFSY